MLYGKEHVQRYQATDGAEGHDWNNTTVLLLTTKGRNSGKPYTTPLIYQRFGDDYLVVASKGGDPEDPQWYKNLLAHPDVEVQVKGDRFKARARTASEEEKPEMWRTMTRTWPQYDE
ncbi:nitroreductase family deazaflavin-dependent oxidoreductase [Nonomuraea sp. NPDC001023]